MSVTIDLSGANTYFGADSHVKTEVWTGFADPQKTAALATAVRLVSREIGGDVADETADSTNYGYRPDWACYEQAIAILEASEAIANADRTAPHYYAEDIDESDEVRQESDDFLSGLTTEAARWLNRPKQQAYTIRG